ncbi:MAG TPA: thiamine pyrophosphate-dependent enzyme [Terriglobales bacterium]|nr:thiamine pyrophosphate-dependent enzyme [Terriglobales bacterium]
MTASDVLIEVLIDWGVEVIFGLPGDGINGIMEALRTHQDKIKFVQVRHEEAAAFMACGYAKTTGKLGVCLATSGPGGIHLLNGLYDAKLDGAPVLAITGLQYHDLIGTMTQQDVALDKLFMDVAAFDERVMGPTHVEPIAELAIRTALAYHRVSHITIPVDVQEKEVKNRQASKRNIPGHADTQALGKSRGLPADADLSHAAEILNKGGKIAILAGRGALSATDELEQLAEKLGAPIIKALLGKACVPDDSPYTTGPIGLLGTGPSQQALEQCETLLMVGTSFPYIEFMPKPGQARGIQIDYDPMRIGLRYPVEVGLIGDSKAVLQALLPRLKRNENRSLLKQAQDGMREWNEYMHKLAHVDTKPMKPQVVAGEIGKRLRSDAIVTCDSGTIATWWARHIPARRGQIHTLSGNLATMAPGLPYAIAAQYAYPNRQVVAFVGDGGFTMLMGDFVTAVKYQLPVKVCIIKNDYLGQIKWEQMVFFGNPEFGVKLHPIDFAAFARACGGTGIFIDDPKRCGDAVEEWLNTPGPAILEAQVDPLTAPMPGKVKASQALHFAESLVRGEPDAIKIAQEAFKDKARELV